MSIIAVGPLRGEKVAYSDGEGVTVWYPLPDDEMVGCCFDLPADDIDDLIELLRRLKDAPADRYEESE